MSGRLGELLVRENLISLQQLQKAQDEQRKTGGRIGSLLVKQGSIAEHDLTNFLSKQYGVPAISLKDFDIDPDVLKLIPKGTAEKHQVVPVNRAGSSLIVAMSDPSNIFAVDDIKFLTGYNVEVVVASEQAIKEAIERYYAEKGPDLDEVMLGFDDSEVAVVEADADDFNVRRPREERRGGAGRQAREPHPPRRDQEGRVGHPRRALREGLPRPLPHRRRAVRGDEAADEAAQRDDLAPQDHGGARHQPSAGSRRTAASS